MTPSFRSRVFPVSITVALAISLVGCGGASEPLGELPPGWEEEPGRWWVAGVDTANAFRPLDDLDAMGIESHLIYASNARLAQQKSLQRDQLIDAVKRSLVRLYRNEPAVVDSIFNTHVTPLLSEASLTGNPEELVERNKKKAYDTIRRHFREPVPLLQLGKDIQVPYPDSLRKRGVAGAIRMQVMVNESGEPQAIELIESVHPLLERIAMRATTEMRWQPAYLLRKQEWKAIPSWSRFTVRFASPDQQVQEPD
ncbi:MAG TPA: energy transducer TonB [Rhodothermales bacterium]